MEQMTYYGYVKTDKARAIAIADAIRVCASHFARDDEREAGYHLNLSDEFKTMIPATREGRVLSGLWDMFDPDGLGIDHIEYHDSMAHAKLTDFGLIFYADYGEFQVVQDVIDKLRGPEDTAKIWWTLPSSDPENSLSGTIVTGSAGVTSWIIPDLRGGSLESGDDQGLTLARLVEDRRFLLEFMSHLTPLGFGGENSWRSGV